MSADTIPETPTLDLREQIARIDNLIIDSQKMQREYHLSIWQMVAAVVGGAAAFLAAGAGLAVAFIKLAGH